MVDNKFVTDIKAKANIFNEYFAKQCILMKKSSVLLVISRLISLDFNEEEIRKIIMLMVMMIFLLE